MAWIKSKKVYAILQSDAKGRGIIRQAPKWTDGQLESALDDYFGHSNGNAAIEDRPSRTGEGYRHFWESDESTKDFINHLKQQFPSQWSAQKEKAVKSLAECFRNPGAESVAEVLKSAYEYELESGIPIINEYTADSGITKSSTAFFAAPPTSIYQRSGGIRIASDIDKGYSYSFIGSLLHEMGHGIDWILGHGEKDGEGIYPGDFFSKLNDFDETVKNEVGSMDEARADEFLQSVYDIQRSAGKFEAEGRGGIRFHKRNIGSGDAMGNASDMIGGARTLAEQERTNSRMDWAHYMDAPVTGRVYDEDTGEDFQVKWGHNKGYWWGKRGKANLATEAFAELSQMSLMAPMWDKLERKEGEGEGGYGSQILGVFLKYIPETVGKFREIVEDAIKGKINELDKAPKYDWGKIR